VNEVVTLRAELKAAKEKVEAEAKARGGAEASAVRCPRSARTPGYSPDASLCGELIYLDTHTQAKLQAKLDKEENKTDASKNNDVQGVGKEATPKPSSGCCSML